MTFVTTLSSKKYQRLLILVFFTICVTLYFSSTSNDNIVVKQNNKQPLQKQASGSFLDYITRKKKKSGYDWAIKLINDHDPKVPSLDQYLNGEKAKEKFAKDTDFIFSKKYLEELVVVNQENFNRLKKNHQAFVQKIKEDDHPSFSSENVKPQGEGIVFVGGLKFSWLSLTIIEQLRHINCTLPIEVFIATKEEYEEEFCKNILPSFNARCSYLPEEMGHLADNFNAPVTGYQYKILSLLVSRFEKILFLDADNAPLFDPEPLLQSEVLDEYGLVTWPDPWARATNPKFYDIAGLKVQNKIVRGYGYGEPFTGNYDTDATFHDLEGALPNPTSESGMILVNKTKHVKSLLLALYYNIYGPGVYYRLFTQGSAGEGDKETFFAAAFVLREKVYQVQEDFTFIGYHDHKAEYQSKALGQKDPIQDYDNYKKGYRSLGKNNPEGLASPRVFFMHLSYPKLTPYLLIEKKPELTPIDDSGKPYHVRLYRGSTFMAGYDFELRMFRIATAMMCPSYNAPKGTVLMPGAALRLKYFLKDKKGMAHCPALIEHLEWLEQNPE